MLLYLRIDVPLKVNRCGNGLGRHLGIFKRGIESKPVVAIFTKITLNVTGFFGVAHRAFYEILASASLADSLADIDSVDYVLIYRYLD